MYVNLCIFFHNNPMPGDNITIPQIPLKTEDTATSPYLNPSSIMASFVVSLVNLISSVIFFFFQEP
mgnify:CR=1 FL=1